MKTGQKLGDRVVFQGVNTFDSEALLEWGIADALLVDGRPVRTGTPPPYERIKRLIAKRVKKLKPWAISDCFARNSGKA